MSTYLLELGLEEIPARFIPDFIQAIQSKWESALSTHNVPFETVTVLATYRRIAILTNNISRTTLPTRNRFRGPLQTIAITDSGELTPAGQGFLKKNGLSTYTIEIENDKPYIVGYIDIPSAPTADRLPEIVRAVIDGIPLPIAMKWGTNQGPFIRPIHWIVSLFDTSHIPITLFGQTSDTWTRGHRFLTHSTEPDWIASGIRYPIESAIQYQSTLRSLSVEVAPEAREAIIIQFLKAHTDEWDAELVKEVVFLTEWPTPIIGTIDATYMSLPSAPIIECIRKNQKYFPAIRNGQLTQSYILVADSAHTNNLAQIRSGNASVLRARLDDVTFFWTEDQKLTPDDANAKLKKVVYQKGLGSIYDKVIRIQVLANELGTALTDDLETHRLIRDAALICKTDLVSQMVLELPKLQGKMGAIYAKGWGYPDPVCNAIHSLYDPIIPTAVDDTVAFCIGVSDRLDTVVSCFKNGLIPTGSQDPWGIRRAALAAIQALLKRAQLTPSLIPHFTVGGLTTDPKCRQFLLDRLRYVLETDFALPYDIVAGVLSESAYFHDIFKFGRALNDLKLSSATEYKQLVETAVRVSRLAEKANHARIDWTLFTTQELDILNPLRLSIAQPQSTISIQYLQAIAQPMPRYFDAVLIMDQDPSIRENRLALLNYLAIQFNRVANFELLVI